LEEFQVNFEHFQELKPCFAFLVNLFNVKVVHSGVTDGGQGGKPPPWQAKCKNWAPFSWNFDISYSFINTKKSFKNETVKSIPVLCSIVFFNLLFSCVFRGVSFFSNLVWTSRDSLSFLNLFLSFG